MNTDTKQQIETALRAFSGTDLRAASIGLLNSLGYQSEKTLDLDSTPDAFLAEFDKRNAEFFDEAVFKLDLWSEDLKQGLEREIKEIDKQIREARKTAALAQSLQDKLEAQKNIKALGKTRNNKRRELFDAQDAIDAQREELIGNIEKQLKQRRSVQTLFCIRWEVK
jgi:adenine-specific DNA-methyltransferase